MSFVELSDSLAEISGPVTRITNIAHNKTGATGKFFEKSEKITGGFSEMDDDRSGSSL